MNPIIQPEPDLTAYNLPLNAVEEKRTPLVAKVFGNMVIQARDALRGNSSIEKIRETDVNFWSIAEAGVKGFNTISDRDLELMVRRDENGKIKSYALVEQDRLLITRNLDNN